MSSVSAGVTMRLVVDGVADTDVPATFTYDVTAPFSVTVVFHTREGDVVWVFGRDLLAEGLRGAAGDGDVTVWRSHSHDSTVVRVALSSPSGAALLEVDPRDVTAFLHATFDIVPVGTEMDTQDIDAELAELLGDDRSSRH